jgi:hypothetical protein
MAYIYRATSLPLVIFFSFHSLRARFDVQRALPSHAQLGNANLVRQNEPDCLFWVGKEKLAYKEIETSG